MTNLRDLFVEEVIWWRRAMEWKDTKRRGDNTVRQSGVTVNRVKVRDEKQMGAQQQQTENETLG